MSVGFKSEYTLEEIYQYAKKHNMTNCKVIIPSDGYNPRGNFLEPVKNVSLRKELDGYTYMILNSYSKNGKGMFYLETNNNNIGDYICHD